MITDTVSTGKSTIVGALGFKVGDKVRLKDGDGREHIIKSFEKVMGLHGSMFFLVHFDDNAARSILTEEYTDMEKIKEDKDYKKKYKDALGWMRDIYPTFEGSMKEDAEHYFPELKEDERIRKEMISYFNSCKGEIWRNNLKIKDCLAYLEKIPTDVEMKELFRTEYEKGRADALAEMQKPTNKVEPKFKVGDAVKDPYGDLYRIAEIKDDSYKTDDGRFILFENQEVYTLFNFTAWSEEDEETIELLIKIFESNKDWIFGNKNNNPVTAQYIIERIKSLRPQKHWKPSEAEIVVLDDVIKNAHLSNANKTILEKLYNELKKLTE